MRGVNKQNRKNQYFRQKLYNQTFFHRLMPEECVLFGGAVIPAVEQSDTGKDPEERHDSIERTRQRDKTGPNNPAHVRKRHPVCAEVTG